MPVILTKVIDFLCRNKGDLQDSYGEVNLTYTLFTLKNTEIILDLQFKLLFCIVGT